MTIVFYFYVFNLNIIQMKFIKSFLLVVLIVSAGPSLFAQKKADPEGTWSFYAQDAPYEYNSGDMVIGKEGKEYTVKLVFGESYEIKGQNVSLEKDELTFTVYIEGETVSVKGTVTKDSINGTASYSDGTVSYKAQRKKE